MKNMLYLIIFSAMAYTMVNYDNHLTTLFHVILWFMVVLGLIGRFNEKVVESVFEALPEYKNKYLYMRWSIPKWIIMLYLAYGGYPYLIAVAFIKDMITYNQAREFYKWGE